MLLNVALGICVANPKNSCLSYPNQPHHYISKPNLTKPYLTYFPKEKDPPNFRVPGKGTSRDFFGYDCAKFNSPRANEKTGMN